MSAATWLLVGVGAGAAVGYLAYRLTIENRKLNAFCDSLALSIREAAIDEAWDQHVTSALTLCGDDQDPETPIYNGIFAAGADRLAARLRDALADDDAVAEWLTGQGRA